MLTPEIIAEGLRLEIAFVSGCKADSPNWREVMAEFDKHALRHYADALREVQRLQRSLRAILSTDHGFDCREIARKALEADPR